MKSLVPAPQAPCSAPSASSGLVGVLLAFFFFPSCHRRSQSKPTNRAGKHRDTDQGTPHTPLLVPQPSLLCPFCILLISLVLAVDPKDIVGCVEVALVVDSRGVDVDGSDPVLTLGDLILIIVTMLDNSLQQQQQRWQRTRTLLPSSVHNAGIATVKIRMARCTQRRRISR